MFKASERKGNEMKKVLLALCLAMLLCGFASCAKEQPSEPSGVNSQESSQSSESLEESTTSESDTIILPVLVGDRVGMYNEYCLTKKAEVSDKATTWRDEARAGDTVEFCLPGTAIPLQFKYDSTTRNAYKKEEIAYCTPGNMQLVILDAETKDLLCFLYLEHPDDFVFKDKKITLGQARDECSHFVNEYFSDIDMSDWSLDYEFDRSDEAMAEFLFCFRRYCDGIEVGTLTFVFDPYGNIEMFRHNEYMNDALPQYTDKEYLASAQARIFEHYYAFDDIVEVTDFQIEEKETAYILSLECNAIRFTVSYTVVLQDGTELNTANEFFLPYDETGKAISVELNKTAES